MKDEVNINQPKYANIMADSVFKNIFGTNEGEVAIISLIESLLPEKTISNVTYINTEQIPRHLEERKSVFDTYCVSDVGERFIVEVQVESSPDFFDRCLYYSTFPIRNQIAGKTKRRKEYLAKEKALKRAGRKLERTIDVKATLGTEPEVNYSLLPIYIVAILDFTLPELRGVNPPQYVYRCVFMEKESKTAVSDKLNFIYLCVPELIYGAKEDDKCETMLEQLMFCFRYMPKLKTRPPKFKGKVFDIIFQKAEIAKMTEKERLEYDLDMAYEIERLAQRSYALRQGREEGLAQGLAKGRKSRETEIVRGMLAAGVTDEQIKSSTGISDEELSTIKADI